LVLHAVEFVNPSTDIIYLICKQEFMHPVIAHVELLNDADLSDVDKASYMFLKVADTSMVEGSLNQIARKKMNSKNLQSLPCRSTKNITLLERILS